MRYVVYAYLPWQSVGKPLSGETLGEVIAALLAWQRGTGSHSFGGRHGTVVDSEGTFVGQVSPEGFLSSDGFPLKDSEEGSL